MGAALHAVQRWWSFQSGFLRYDSTLALCSLGDSQRLFSLEIIASVLEFKVDDIYHAAADWHQIEAAAGKDSRRRWMEQNRALVPPRCD